MDVVIANASEVLTTQHDNSSLVRPIMHALTSLFLLGSVAVQHVFARPNPAGNFDAAILKRSVDDFVAKEEPIAVSKLLCNIGASGCAASGASAGIVIASPSKSDPDCKWTH